MAEEVHKNLFVGDLQDCQSASDFSIVHACKDPCHKIGVGYQGNLSPNHPNYLIKESSENLYLNLVDMNKISPKYTNEPINKSILFIQRKLKEGKKVLIHCNIGQSRSCSIAMVYLARNDIISKESFDLALTDFIKLYSNTNLGIGFRNYLSQNWDDLMRFKDEA
jgi:hypothetical protein